MPKPTPKIDFSKITMDELGAEHPERVKWKMAYADYALAYRGGLEFKRAAGMQQSTIASGVGSASGGPVFDAMADRSRRRRFLLQLEGEPDTKYISRWEKCYYVSYVHAIIDYFCHYLFSSEPVLRPALDAEGQQQTPPEWFPPFAADASGCGESLLDMAKALFTETLIYRRTGWLIGLPDADIGAKGTDAKRPPVALTAYNAQEILDWQEDESGELEWILLSKKQTRREFPDKRYESEVRTYVDKDTWAAWEVCRTDQGTHEAALIAEGKHSLGVVPFEWLTVPHGMWVMDQLFAWQLDLFNAMSMLTYSTQVACFLQPYIKSHEGSESATNRILGEGILLSLRAGDKDREGEDFGWKSPDVSPLEFQDKRLQTQRDEGYRIVHQMSLAVDSQSAQTAIARSGASKVEDRRSAEIILGGYGTYVRAFLLRTLTKISKILGDNTEWIVDGFDNFEISSMEDELNTAALAQTFDIPSPTFKAELAKNIATSRILGRADDAIKAKIREEIDGGIAMQHELMSSPPQTDPETGEVIPNAPPAKPAIDKKSGAVIPPSPKPDDDPKDDK